MTSSCKVGFVDILILYDVYMIRELNALNRTLNGYWKSLASRMYAQPEKIRNLMQSMKGSMMHQTVTNVLRTLLHTNPPQNMTQARDMIDDSLANAMHAVQTTVATTLKSTPSALAFAQDMSFNMPLIADWQAIAGTHEYHVN
jgi:hypothetical protein